MFQSAGEYVFVGNRRNENRNATGDNDLFIIDTADCSVNITIIRSDNLMSEIFRMNTILWDGENVFPEKVETFKNFLKKKAM